MWIGDNRGSKTSQKRTETGELVDFLTPDYWDFTFQDMVTKDMRAFIFKIYEMTGRYDIKLITYGQGLNQVLYGLTQEPRFFSNTVGKIIAMAPCVYQTPFPDGISQYEASLGQFKNYGVYSVNDPYWLVNKATLC